MIAIVTSQNFEVLRLERTAEAWGRHRRAMGWDFARAAAAHGVTIREWAMLECGVSPDDLRNGTYAAHAKADQRREQAPRPTPRS